MRVYSSRFMAGYCNFIYRECFISRKFYFITRTTERENGNIRARILLPAQRKYAACKRRGYARV